MEKHVQIENSRLAIPRFMEINNIWKREEEKHLVEIAIEELKIEPHSDDKLVEVWNRRKGYFTFHL